MFSPKSFCAALLILMVQLVTISSLDLVAKFKDESKVDLDEWINDGSQTRLKIIPYFSSELNLPTEAYWCANSTSKQIPDYLNIHTQALDYISRQVCCFVLAVCPDKDPSLFSPIRWLYDFSLWESNRGPDPDSGLLRLRKNLAGNAIA